MKYSYQIAMLISMFLYMSCSKDSTEIDLAKQIKENSDFTFVKEKARKIVAAGFNAGDGYGEVWIRDFNTFIELSSEVYDPEMIEKNLLVFFKLQDEDGGIIDGFIPKEKAVHTEGGYQYIYNELEPDFCGHKNTVETDHETSLVQSVYKFVQKTGRKEFLSIQVGEQTVLERMGFAMEFLLNKRWSDEFGLIYGATTADWGDVQHEHPWGVYITDETHYCVDIYDNAMFLIALQNLIEMDEAQKEKWQKLHDKIAENTMKVLWDEQNSKFIPHVYLDGSPYPDDFNENEIYYHGGTAVAIEAGLLSKKQILEALGKMTENVEKSGAGSIGLTLYPPYPDWAFENKGMYPYGYQNGGDWTWFGGRMIIELARNEFYQEAYDNLQPMTHRVVVNDGFYEWYTVDNKPEGSGTFRGSAGVLYKSIELLEDWANKNEKK